MNNQKGLISTLILILSFALVIIVVGGAIYLDSTGGWSKIGVDISDDKNVDQNVDVITGGEQQGEEIVFISYQSLNQLYQLQIPDFWTGEERAGATIFYSYDPEEGLPEQRAKIEISQVENPDMMTSIDWLSEQNIDATSAQQAIFGTVSGTMILQDDTETNPGGIKSVIYMPVNDQIVVVTAESFGGTRDVAVQFFNAILNSWQWVGEVISPDLLVADAIAEVEGDTVGEEDLVEGEELPLVEGLESVSDKDDLFVEELLDESTGDVPPEEVLE